VAIESLVSEALALLARIGAQGATARTLGGVAVALRCPTAQEPSALARRPEDIDLVTRHGDVKAVSAVILEAGFVADAQFNTMGAGKRLRYVSTDGDHVDVFIDVFEMCHRLDLGARLEVDADTIPLADLLLTKLQVAQMTRKDLSDIVCLLADHELTSTDEGVNVEYIGALLARDWGWWQTVQENIQRVGSRLDEFAVSDDVRTTICGRLAELSSAIADRPKTRRWRLRARVGDRVPWREEPEEA
jgi:hypothetical protein